MSAPRTLEQRWPALPWRVPLHVTWPDAQFYACRLCIGLHGLTRNSPHQWATEIEAQRHIDSEHPQGPMQ
jgi:hypothetical protein